MPLFDCSCKPYVLIYVTSSLVIFINHANAHLPGYEDHSGTPGDKLNFTKLLAAIKAALETLTRSTGKVYGLTAALPCNPDNIANIEVGKISTILTEFNLMSYDLHGSWDEVTGTNAPLYYQGFGNEEFNIHSCVEAYVNLGVPREKISE